MTRKSQARGDKQLRVDDTFDRARAANESASKLRKSNRVKLDAVIDERTKHTKCGDNLSISRFAPAADDVSWKLFSAGRPGEYIGPPASCAAKAAA